MHHAERAMAENGDAPDRPIETDCRGVNAAGLDEDGVNTRALMAIVHALPRYEPIDDIEAISIYADVRNALASYLATYAWFADARQQGRERPTIGTMRESMGRLDAALAELEAAWVAADLRSKDQIYLAAGEPSFDDSEMTPRVPMPDQWDRGAYRAVKFREQARRIAAAVSKVRKDVDEAEQERRRPNPGLDELVERLACIFAARTGQPVTYSRITGGALAFAQEVIGTLPTSSQPSNDMVFGALRRYLKARVDSP